MNIFLDEAAIRRFFVTITLTFIFLAGTIHGILSGNPVLALVFMLVPVVCWALGRPSWGFVGATIAWLQMGLYGAPEFAFHTHKYRSGPLMLLDFGLIGLISMTGFFCQLDCFTLGKG